MHVAACMRVASPAAPCLRQSSVGRGMQYMRHAEHGCAYDGAGPQHTMLQTPSTWRCIPPAHDDADPQHRASLHQYPFD
eukprot:358307-Chlamydomonas_euryale.AAC.2